MSDDPQLNVFLRTIVDDSRPPRMSASDDPLLRALDKAITRRKADRQPKEGEQVITGHYGTVDYAAVVSCYRTHEKLDFQGTLYRVRWVQIRDGSFRAGVVKV